MADKDEAKEVRITIKKIVDGRCTVLCSVNGRLEESVGVEDKEGTLNAVSQMYDRFMSK